MKFFNLMCLIFIVSWQIKTPAKNFWSLSTKNFEDLGEATRFAESLFANPDITAVKITLK